MTDETLDHSRAAAVNDELDRMQSKTAALAISANGFAGAMTRAFNQSVIGGKQLDDVLRSLALRMSSLVVNAAFKPIAKSITRSVSGGLDNLFSGLLGNDSSNALGGIKPFAAGGVIGTPTYFPLTNGGLGLAGEAGPEAILPLARGPDGSLGVASSGGGSAAPNVTIHITTPDADSFRRSESYIAGQIARAVARGQRSL